MTTNLDYSPSDSTRITQFFRDAHTGSSGLWTNAWIMLAMFALCQLLPLLDGRTLIGVSVWEKPAKFFLSLSVQFFTVAWALSTVTLRTRGLRIAVAAMIAAGWLEIVFIVGRAARGEASHFNTATALDATLYAIMGIGAVTLTVTAGYIGWVIWRQGRGNLWPQAAGLGLLLGSVLTTLTAGYMSSQTGGHWVGGDLTDATGLPFFHWSTTGGDLRVSHFIALHASQVVPFAAMSQSRRIVFAAAIVIVMLTAATFAQAVMGIPLFRT